MSAFANFGGSTAQHTPLLSEAGRRVRLKRARASCCVSPFSESLCAPRISPGRSLPCLQTEEVRDTSRGESAPGRRSRDNGTVAEIAAPISFCLVAHPASSRGRNCRAATPCARPKRAPPTCCASLCSASQAPSPPSWQLCSWMERTACAPAWIPRPRRPPTRSAGLEHSPARRRLPTTLRSPWR